MKDLKAIVLLLVVANVGYFLYAHGVAPPPPSPQADGSGASLKLVTTKSPAAAATPTTGATPTTAPTPATAAAPAARCVSIGPFGELAESAHAQATLRGGGYLPRQRAIEADVTDGVLVYLTIPATPAATAQLRKKLKGAGIADAPDVPGPNDSTVISLGLFSDPQRAQVRIASLRQAGFSPQSLEHKRSGTVVWLDVDLKPEDPPLNAADLRADSAHALPLEVRECPAPGAAPSGALPAAAAGDASSAASAAR